MATLFSGSPIQLCATTCSPGVAWCNVIDGIVCLNDDDVIEKKDTVVGWLFLVVNYYFSAHL